jgi:hypothetical protein
VLVPFYKLESDDLPTITLQVIGPTEFKLLEGFRYEDRYDPQRKVRVAPGRTDLASVPFFLQWLVRSYGRHTMAALVHDHLWKRSRKVARLRSANTVFRDAMWELGVPWIRRWLMWATVTLGMLTRGWIGRAQLSLWIIGLTVSASAIAAAVYGRITWGATLWVVASAAIVAALSASVAISARRARFTLVAQGAWWAGGVVAAIGVLALIVGMVAQVDLVVQHPTMSAATSLSIGLAGWGPSIGAGIIVTTALVALTVPIVAVFTGLLIYGVFELGAMGVLRAGRVLKKLFNRKPTGRLNAPATRSLYVE